MFVIPNGLRKFLALLLPAGLLCSYLACTAICSEFAQQPGAEKHSLLKIDGAENDGAEMAGAFEGCCLKVTPAAFQERPPLYARAPVNSGEDHRSRQGLKLVPSAARDSNVARPSPPRLAPPLYLLLRSIRI